jgi:hypothetical protein
LRWTHRSQPSGNSGNEWLSVGVLDSVTATACQVHCRGLFSFRP